MSALRRYAALVSRPGVTAAVVLSLLCRLPMGMTPLAVLLVVQEQSGSFTTAGVTTGCYAAAVALVAPLRSRVVDRSGMVPVLVTSGVGYPVALTGLLLAATGGAPAPLLVVLALASGLAFPPVASVMRVLWAGLAPDDAGRQTAYSLESVLVETGFVLGPLGVAVAVAAGSPGSALVAAALLVGVGSLGLARSPLVRHWRPERNVQRSVSGPLRSRPLRALWAVAACLGVAVGAVEVAVPAIAAAAGTPAAAGVLLAVWSLGSIAGGLWYGGRDARRPPAEEYPWLLALLAAGTVLPLLAAGPVSLGALLLLSGLTFAPLLTCNSSLVARLAPAGTVTEAFGWSTTAIFGGVSLGTAAGGALVEAVGSEAALALAPAAAAVGLVLGVTRRGLLAAPAVPVPA